jgi:hypothetical protein
MRYVIGFIIGVAVTIGGAAAYDNMGGSPTGPLVNWTTANSLQKNTVEYVRGQFDRWAKQLGII